MQCAVWHVKREFARFGFGEQEMRFPLHYELVAYVDGRDHNLAFQLTNHIDKPWYDNEGVHDFSERHARSTSVGDVIVMPGNKILYLCLPFGWKQYNGVPQKFPADLYDVVGDDAPTVKPEITECPCGCCGCRKCLEGQKSPETGLPLTMTRMVLCPKCGNKRCPHATDHDLACTGSNKPGQKGSFYE